MLFILCCLLSTITLHCVRSEWQLVCECAISTKTQQGCQFDAERRCVRIHLRNLCWCSKWMWHRLKETHKLKQIHFMNVVRLYNKLSSIVNNSVDSTHGTSTIAKFSATSCVMYCRWMHKHMLQLAEKHGL